MPDEPRPSPMIVDRGSRIAAELTQKCDFTGPPPSPRRLGWCARRTGPARRARPGALSPSGLPQALVAGARRRWGARPRGQAAQTASPAEIARRGSRGDLHAAGLVPWMGQHVGGRPQRADRRITRRGDARLGSCRSRQAWRAWRPSAQDRRLAGRDWRTGAAKGLAIREMCARLWRGCSRRRSGPGPRASGIASRVCGDAVAAARQLFGNAVRHQPLRAPAAWRRLGAPAAWRRLGAPAAWRRLGASAAWRRLRATAARPRIGASAAHGGVARPRS
jgi:hypothetical protein